MRGTSTLGVVVLLLGVGCDDTVHRWTVGFEDAATAALAVRVEASIDRDGCGGETIFETSVERDGLEGMQVPSLDPGTYGFRAIAIDGDCRVIAERCEALEVPRGDGNVSVFVSNVAARDTCDGFACVAGVCTQMPRPDAGVDAGGRDAGAPDAGQPDGGPGGISPPLVLFPWNGVDTGTALISGVTTILDHPQRPVVRWEEGAEPAQSYLVEWVACEPPDLGLCDFSAPALRVVTPGTERSARSDGELPVETTTAPLGRRYAFRVGACAMPAGADCSFSSPRYVNVGRVPGDLEGDGTSELLLVRRRAMMDDDLVEPNSYRAGMAVNVRFSAPLIEGGARIGDYDGDGVGELMIDRGAADGLRYVDDYTESGTLNLDARDVVRLGDVDGDGFADFAVELADEVQVYLGGATFDPTRVIILRAPVGVMDFPLAIGAGGDRDGDGFADLIVLSRIGADQARVDTYSLATRIAVRVGSGEVLATGEVGVPTGFRIVVAGGFDMDDDGRPEVAVSMPLLRTVFILRGDGTTETSPTFDSQFDLPVAMGQMDGTGRARVVVGEPEHRSGFGETGRLWHLRFSGGLSSTAVTFFPRDRFGRSLALGDFEGTGFEGWGARGGTGNAVHIGLFDGVSVGGDAHFLVAPSGTDYVGSVR